MAERSDGPVDAERRGHRVVEQGRVAPPQHAALLQGARRRLHVAAASPTHLQDAQRSVHTTHYTLHTTHYTLHTTRYTLHTTHYTLHTTHYTLHTTHYTLQTTHYTLHTKHYTLHTTHYKLHTTHYILNTTHYTHCSHLGFRSGP